MIAGRFLQLPFWSVRTAHPTGLFPAELARYRDLLP
jgi:hypothetical protein